MEVLGSIMHEWRTWRWVQVLVQEKRHRLIIWGGVGCFLVLSLLAMAGDRGFLELNEFNRHLQRLEDQIRALEEENLQVRRQVIGLKSDPYQIERVAREDLGLARPDELIFVIIDGLDTMP
jgi:cell division protein FtsB